MQTPSFLRPASRRAGQFSKLVLVFCALAASAALRATTIVPVPVNGTYDSISGDYTMQVDDGAGNDLSTVSVVNHFVEYPAGTVHHNIYYGRFSYGPATYGGSGAARVMITLNLFASNYTNYSVTLSPVSYGITPSMSGNVVSFTIPATQPGYFMLKVTDPNSTYQYYLAIIADTLENLSYTVPVSGNAGVYNITASPYNASGTYSANCSAAINSAMTDAYNYATAHSTSATVFVPYNSAGSVYLINSSIIPKSNVQLYLAPGAIIRADTGRTGGVSNWGSGSTKYLINEAGNGGSPADGALSNFTVFGRGELDCEGIAVGGDTTTKTVAQPQSMCALDLVDTNNTTINGVTIRESTGFTFMNDRSANLSISNTKVINYAQDFNSWRENDGMDMISCQNSYANHIFIFTADDAVALKGGNSSTDESQILSGVYYNDGVFYTGAGGCKFGNQAWTDVENSGFSNIDIVKAQRPLQVEAGNGDGTAGTWKNLSYGGIIAEQVTARPIYFQVANDATAESNIAVTDYTAQQLGPDVSQIDGGSSSADINGVTFTNMTIAGTLYLSTNTNLTANTYTSNVTFNGADSNLILNAPAQTSSDSTNWSTTTGDTVTDLNDGSITDQAEATNTANAWVVYNFVVDKTLDSARIYQDGGSFSCGSWCLQYWSQSAGAWVNAFNTATGYMPCPIYGWNTVYFAPVVGTGVKIIFVPNADTDVGVQEVQVYGR